jgi:hypothetical protein
MAWRGEYCADDEGPKTGADRDLEAELGSFNMDDMMKEMMQGGAAGPADMDPAMMAVITRFSLPSFFLPPFALTPFLWFPNLFLILAVSWLVRRGLLYHHNLTCHLQPLFAHCPPIYSTTPLFPSWVWVADRAKTTLGKHVEDRLVL